MLPGPTQVTEGQPHLLPHDAGLSLEPKVGFLLVPKLSLVLGFDVLDLSVFIFFNLLLGFLKLPKLLSDIFLCLAQREGQKESVLGEGAGGAGLREPGTPRA